MVKDIRFEKILKGLYNELLKANIHFKIYWELYLASPNIADIRNLYLSFFVYTMNGHNNIFCVALYNVVKHDSDTANFYKMFNYIKSSNSFCNLISLEEIDEMESIISSHKSFIERIAIIRDQYIAHNQLNKRHLVGQAKYEYEEGKKLLIDLNDILEKLSYKYDQTRYWKDDDGLLDISPHLNIDTMLQDLYNYRKINQA